MNICFGSLFNFFKRKIHEPLADQLADLERYPPDFAKLIRSGLDCDVVPGATGPFGSSSNPIPVNGAIGAVKYIGKLRGQSGFALFFHRIGSFSLAISEHPIDIYETVCMDGSQWANLNFDMYHPRRSNLAPDGYTLMPLDRRMEMDMPFAFGVNGFVSDFPHGLPEALVKFYGEQPGAAFARRARERLETYNFIRPEKVD